MAIVNERWVSQAQREVPAEGLYWPVSQYQITHHRLKQELRAIAAGEPANMPELSRWAAVLTSKSSILTEPSETRTVLLRVPGYLAATQQLGALVQSIGPTLDRAPFVQADARSVLTEMNAVDDDELLGRLSSEARLADAEMREATLRELTWRLRLLWAALATSLFVLVMWMLYAVRSRHRYLVVAQQRQLALEAMDGALIAKRKFLSMVNHEVRSPLQSIVAATEVLAAGERQPKSVAAVRRIQHAVILLQGQLRDLLTIARSDETALTTAEEIFDFAELVQDVCADLSEIAESKGLAFGLVLPQQPLIVAADPVRIAQVLRNLVENAVRYTTSGRIDVVAEIDRTSSPDVQPVGSEIVSIRIQDSGPGLPAGALKNLQGGSSPFKPSLDGSGIGLLVVRDVLHKLGGNLTVSATSPVGTTIIVTLPVHPAGAAAARIEPTSDRQLNILLVDDREDVLTALSDVVHLLGHACAVANGSATALEVLNAATFDAVLVDLWMPGGMDGLGLATAVRNGSSANAASMVILMSAAENRSIGQLWPFDGFLQKPIGPDALRRLIGSRKQP